MKNEYFGDLELKQNLDKRIETAKVITANC